MQQLYDFERSFDQISIPLFSLLYVNDFKTKIYNQDLYIIENYLTAFWALIGRNKIRARVYNK